MTSLSFQDLYEKIITSTRPLTRLVNCGSSCYFDCLLSIIVGCPDDDLLKRLLLSPIVESDKNSKEWAISFRMAIARCILTSVFVGNTTCDHWNIRDLLALKNQNFQRGISNDPTEVLTYLTESCKDLLRQVYVSGEGKIKNTRQFAQLYPSQSVWNQERWPFCLSHWLNHFKFRITYREPSLIVDAKDKAYTSFQFEEEFGHFTYCLVGVIQRVHSTHYISKFLTRDLIWVEYDDASPWMYRKTNNSHEEIFKIIDNEGNGTVMLFYIADHLLKAKFKQL